MGSSASIVFTLYVFWLFYIISILSDIYLLNNAGKKTITVWNMIVLTVDLNRSYEFFSYDTNTYIHTYGRI